MTPQPRARKYDPDADVNTRSDTVASPVRLVEGVPASGFNRREQRELQPYTARSTELLPTSDDPTVVDGPPPRRPISSPRAAEERGSLTPSRPSGDRASLTPSRPSRERVSFTPSHLVGERVSVTPSRVLEPTLSLAPPRVPGQPFAPHQDPSAAVPPAGRARGVDYGPWLLVVATTLAAAVIGAALGYVTRPNGDGAPAPTALTAPAPRATAAPLPAARVEPSAPSTPPARIEAPAATSTVPVMRLGELPVDEPVAPEPSAEPTPPAPARRAPAPRSAVRHR